MKGTTSEDNLINYFKTSPDKVDPIRLNQKIKSIKAALKLAERHNEQLHLKIKTLKENHQLQVLHLDHQLRKSKQRYQSLLENYQLKNIQLKQCKKRIKRMQTIQAFSTGAQITIDEVEETSREYRQTIIKQEKEISKFREQARLLYQQIYEKSNRIKELEQILHKSHGKAEHKDRTFLANLRNALENKNDQFEKILQQKMIITSAKSHLQKQNTELTLRITKLSTQLEMEKKNQLETNIKLEKQQREVLNKKDQLKKLTDSYNQLLIFSYDLQKDIERDISGINRELNRKEMNQ